MEEKKNVTENVEPVAEKSGKKAYFSAGNIAIMGILTAIAFVLYAFVKFPLAFMFPSWLDIQISDLPALLGGFALGPVAGCIIIVVKCCLKMPMTGTGCVGELADIIVGIAFVLPASLIYKYHKNKKGAILGMVLGSACAVAASVLANWVVLIPFYAKHFFGGGDYAVGLETICGMVSVLYNGVNTENFYVYYLFLAVVPFNILRCAICAIITYFTYKPLSRALHWEIKTKKSVDVSDDVNDGEKNAD